MRLVCPNCGAQYEVEAQVIPEDGRDVQCSNCGHTWFQRALHEDQALAEELGMTLAEDPEATDAASHAEPDPQERDAPEFDDETDDGFEDSYHDRDLSLDETLEAPASSVVEEYEEDFDDFEESGPTSHIRATPSEAPDGLEEDTPGVRRTLDDGVLNILREEAEREQRARSEETVIETQPDLGDLDAGHDRPSLRARMARLRGVEELEAAKEATGRRRDLLPDIEEINSTLTAAEDRDNDGSVPDQAALNERRARTGFRLTFMPIVLAAIIAVLLYVFAPRLVAIFPGLTPALDAYVTTANGVRDGFDGVMTVGIEKLTSLLAQISGGGTSGQN